MASRKRKGSTITQAKESYARNVPFMPANYNAGMKAFFEGQDVSGSAPAGNYAAKIRPGIENKWADNMKRKFGVR